MIPNDPAADPEVERVARILFCTDAVYEPDGPGPDGDPHWRDFVRVAVSAIAAHQVLTS